MMGVWSGLGVNYKSLTNIASDMAYFKKIGLSHIRVHIPAYNAADIADWRTCAATFKTDPFFYVIYGASQATTTSANWEELANGVKAEALYCQNNDVCHEFQIGNEFESHKDGSITTAQIRTNLRALATEVQAIFTKGPVSYSVGGDTALLDWVTDDDLGGLDLLGVNIYGTIGTGKKVADMTYLPNLNTAFMGLGNKVYVTEFHLDWDEEDIITLSPINREIGMRNELELIKGYGVEKALVYSYRGYKDTNNAFSMCNTDNTFTQEWNALLTNNGRRIFLEV